MRILQDVIDGYVVEDPRRLTFKKLGSSLAWHIWRNLRLPMVAQLFTLTEHLNDYIQDTIEDNSE